MYVVLSELRSSRSGKREVQGAGPCLFVIYMYGYFVVVFLCLLFLAVPLVDRDLCLWPSLWFLSLMFSKLSLALIFLHS